MQEGSKDPKIAVVVLNYNSAEATIKLLSMLGESTDNRTIIVVDNDSTDTSYAQIQAYQVDRNFELIETHQNGGFAFGNNFGIRRARELKCDYVMLMNSDVQVSIQVINKVAAFMQQTPSCAICSPSIETAEGATTYGRKIYLGKIHSFSEIKPENLTQPIDVDSVVGACFMIRMSAIDKVGLIPEPYFLNFEETEWCLRFKRSGYKVMTLPNVQVTHQNHGVIDTISGLQEYFMRRNLVMFQLRMSNLKDKVWFLMKIIPFGIVQSLKRRSSKPICAYIDGITGKNRFSSSNASAKH